MMSSLLRRIARTVVTLAGLATPQAMAGEIAAFHFQPGTETLWQVRADHNAKALASGRVVLEIVGSMPGMRPVIGTAEAYADNQTLNDERWGKILAALGVNAPRHWRTPEFRALADLARNELSLGLEPLSSAGWACPWELMIRAPQLAGAIAVPAKDGAKLRLPKGIAVRPEPIGEAPYAAIFWQGSDGTVEEVELLEVTFTGTLHLVVSDSPIRLALVDQNISSRGGSVLTNSQTVLTGQLACKLQISPR